LAVYLISAKNDYVRWDDDWYIQENPQILELSPGSISDLFTTFFKGQYSPVSTLILGIQYHLSGGTPALLHFFSLLFHLANTLLVFIFIRKISDRFYVALFTAALFALHPMQVEAVAWISAQKVILYTFFFLASMILYLRYIEKQGYTWYLYSILAFLLSFFSKEQAVMLPVTLIGIDYLLGRDLLSKRVIMEKVPFLILSVIMGVVTIYSSRTGEFYQAEKNIPLLQQLV
jgi:hypothetical protein